MKKLTLLCSALFAGLTVFGKVTDKTLEVHYFEQAPFAYMQNGKVAGIEIEIVQAFTDWAKQKKQTNIQLTYKAYQKFDEFYASIRDGKPNMIGLGTVSITDERKQQVAFSPAYMNNISLLITDGKVGTLENLAEIATKFAQMSGVTTKGSIHAIYMEQLKSSYFPDLKIEYVESPSVIPTMITENSSLFGYIDIITFWSFVKKSDHFIKIHRVGNMDHEKLGFILPKTNDFGELLGEFFESGFGFTATRQYQDIMEKYLAHEVLSTVELD